MESKVKVFFPVILAAVLVFSMSVTAEAQSNKIPVSLFEYDCFTGLEKEWVEGQVYHMRNVSHTNLDVSNFPLVNGINTTLADAEINLTTGVIVIRGSNRIQPYGINGTWEGTWLFINNNGTVKGTNVAHGTGELSGKTLFLTIHDEPYDSDTELMCEGIGFPEGNVSATGYILDNAKP